VRDGQLLLQCCTECAEPRYPPGPTCPRCGCQDWKPKHSPGHGTVYSWVLSHHPGEFDAEQRIVVLVELEEGVRIVANLCQVSPAEVRNEMPVEVFFTEFDDVPLMAFRPRAV